jgi:uncharacterized protein
LRQKIGKDGIIMFDLMISVVGAYALVCIGARVLHRRFIYLPRRAPLPPARAGLFGVQELSFESHDGVTLNAWYLPAKLGKPTFIYFIGNRGRAASRADKIRAFQKSGYGVFMLNYRRYGGSGGWPSEVKNIADAAMAYDKLRELGVPANHIVAYGESLGSSVATRLALQREVAALVLEAPFTSAVDVGRQRWWMLPLSLVMVDQYRTIDHIGEVDAPVVIMHGACDSLTPVKHACRLYEAASAPKELIILPLADHDDLYRHGAWQALRACLETGVPAKAPRQPEPQRFSELAA